MDKTIKLGDVSVDSGTIWVGDPCYSITDDASFTNELNIKTWSDWCSRLNDIGHFDRRPGFSEPLGVGIGMEIQTLWGDGSYPVTAVVDANDNIKSVTINFDPVCCNDCGEPETVVEIIAGLCESCYDEQNGKYWDDDEEFN